MRTYQKPIMVLVLFLVTIIIGSCGGGGAGSSGGASGGYDGTYDCTGTSVTPAGSSSGSGSFSCLNGHCADSSGAFSGNVDGNGSFSGTDVLCPTCTPLPMSGVFSKTSAFTISGHSGSVSATFTCHYSGGGGNPGGGSTVPTITSFSPTSGTPGTIVILRGQNFPNYISDVSIIVCGVFATVLSVSTTEIVFLIPSSLGTQSCAVNLATSSGNVTASNYLSVTPLILPTGSYVYWTEGGFYVDQVRRVGINGGTITDIAPALGGPGSIAINNNTIYWIEDGSRALNAGAVRKVALTGGDVTTLATGLNNCPNMAVDSSSVYWTQSYVNGYVQKVGVNGGSITAIETGSNGADGIAVDATSVYWVDFSSGAVKKRLISGGTVTLVSGRPYPNRIAVDSTSIYWTESGFGSGGNVMKVALSGGPTTTLASGLNSPWSITVNTNYVYWSEYAPNGRIMRVLKTGGGTEETLATGLDSPKGIDVDSTYVYWAEDGARAIKKVSLISGITSTLASGIGYPAYVTVYPH
jgi:hypothetical protein